MLFKGLLFKAREEGRWLADFSQSEAFKNGKVIATQVGISKRQDFSREFHQLKFVLLATSV